MKEGKGEGGFSLFKFNFPQKMGFFVSAGSEEFRVLVEAGSGWSEHNQVFLQ